MIDTSFDPSTDWTADRSRPIIFGVRSWFHPSDGGPFLKWLEEKHMAEVLAEPGVLNARKIILDQTDENGWWCCLVLYDMKDRAALEAYLASPTRERFWEELEEFGHIHYSDRFWGEVDLSLTKQ